MPRVARPTTKNVACAWLRESTRRMAGVRPDGPSSNVSATIR